MPSEDPSLPADLATGLEPAAGRLLVATPLLGDPNFERTVVLLLDVDADGALGVVLNRPTEREVASVLGPWHDVVHGAPVLFEGGPVSPDNALAVATLDLGTAEEAGPEGVAVPEGPVGWRPLFAGCGLVDLDAPIEVVRPALATLRIFAGYAGWSTGQLEDEIASGGWFVVPGEARDSAADRPDTLWVDVLRRQGGALAWVASYPRDPSAN